MDWQNLDLYPIGFEHIVEMCGELCIAVTHQIGRLFVAIGGVHQKVPWLLRDPRGIRVRCGVADKNIAGLDVDEDQQEIVHDSPRRDDALREEITSPQGLGVHPDELFPRAARPLGRGVDPLLFENVTDGLPADAVDAQPPQLAQESSVADAGFASDLTDQFAEDLPLPRSPWLGRLVAASLFPDPAMERTRGDDADQAVDVLAQRFPKFEQPGAFLRLGVNFARDAIAEDRQFSRGSKTMTDSSQTPKQGSPENHLEKLSSEVMVSSRSCDCNFRVFRRRRATRAQLELESRVKTSRSAFVPLEQSAESFAADDVIQYDGVVFSWWVGTSRDAEFLFVAFSGEASLSAAVRSVYFIS